MNPLPDMLILGASSSMANKDMISKNMNKWGYSYLIELKTLWEKEKLLVTSNFPFSHYVFKSCLLLMRQNEYLWSKGLSNCRRRIKSFTSNVSLDSFCGQCRS